MLKAKNDNKKIYYLDGLKAYLAPQETPENFETIFSEYQEAYENKKKQINHLYNEIKEIKKLKL